jgi:hypothetical protein
MFHVPNLYRLKHHKLLASTDEDGNNGFFIIPHKKINGYYYRIQASDGEGWEHVSVTLGADNKPVNRCPTWAEMCYIKDIFWNKQDCVIQYHPPESENINNHPFCLHLWRPVALVIPIPDKYLVGIPQLQS